MTHLRGRKAAVKPAGGALDKVPRPPAHLSAEAKAEWRRIMPELITRGVLTAADLTGAEIYACAVGDIAAARKAIATDGAYLVNSHGDMKRHPAWSTLREATTAARQWAGELGLSPASRSRISGDGSDNADDSGLDL